MFFEPLEFEFTRALESNWLVIRQELEQLQSKHFMPWPEKYLYDEGWEVFGFYAANRRIEQNCRLCPETARLIEAIPGITTAGFSSLLSGAHIAPHVGASKAVLRCHLGLIVPEPCRIRVGTQTNHWEEGRCLIFDDTLEHEAWNNSDRTRIVLLIDFKRPGATPNKFSEIDASFDEAYWSNILTEVNKHH